MLFCNVQKKEKHWDMLEFMFHIAALVRTFYVYINLFFRRHVNIDVAQANRDRKSCAE